MTNDQLQALLQQLKTLNALQLKAVSEYCDSVRWDLERKELARFKNLEQVGE